MCLLLGFMVSLARVTDTTRNTRSGFLQGDQRERVNRSLVDVEEFERLSEEVARLRAEKTKLENAVASQSGQASLLNSGLQELKIFANLTEAEGPGIVVTLQDSPQAIKAGMESKLPGGDATVHDTDVLRVVNELYISGAEAISVNGRRLGFGSNFRCVGPVIHVDSVPTASPVVIRAIGDPATLSGGLNIPLGVLAEIRASDPAMVQVEMVKKMRIPAYAGVTKRKYAVVPKDKN
ncbi:MAG: DUF881 domain-containing protein [Fimbriimonas sp.]